MRQAKRYFNKIKDNGSTTLSPEAEAVALAMGVHSGGTAEWEWVWGKYMEEKSPGKKNVYLEALAETQNRKLLQRLGQC